MILVIGGMASGKRTYVRSLGFSDNQMDDGQLGSNPVALNVQNLVSAGCENELDGKSSHLQDLVDALAAKEVITCLEVGNGVIPLDRSERVWRDRVGHLASALAQRADSVVRMVCGIPVVLK